MYINNWLVHAPNVSNDSLELEDLAVYIISSTSLDTTSSRWLIQSAHKPEWKFKFNFRFAGVRTRTGTVLS